MSIKPYSIVIIGLLILMVGCNKSDSLVDNSYPATIQGILVDNYGIPLQGYHITALGKTTTTLSDGTFSINDISAPYDLIITPGVYIFKDITNRNLTLKLLNLTQGSSHNGIIKVKVDTLNAGVKVIFENGNRHWQGGLIDGSGLFRIDVDWTGSSPIIGTIHILKSIGIPPSSYIGYGSRTVSLIDTTTVYFVKSDFSDPGEYPLDVSSISGTSNAYSFSLFKGDVPIIPLWDGSFLLSQTKLYVPSIQNLNIGFQGAYYGLNNSYSFVIKNGLSSSAPIVSVSWGTIPQLSSPSTQTNGITMSTIFDWTNTGTGGVYLFSAIPDTNINAPKYYIWTEKSSISLPDLSALGILFPHNNPYYWSVYSYYSVNSINSLTSTSITSPIVTGNYSWSQRNRFRTAQ
jgi:hypothetical protein